MSFRYIRKQPIVEIDEKNNFENYRLRTGKGSFQRSALTLGRMGGFGPRAGGGKKSEDGLSTTPVYHETFEEWPNNDITSTSDPSVDDTPTYTEDFEANWP